MLPLFLAFTAHAEPLQQVLDEIAPLRVHRECATAPEIPAKAYESITLGAVDAGVIMVEDVAAGKGWGLALYDVPIEAIWMAINDQDSAEGRPVEVSKIVSGPLHAEGRRLFQYIKVPLAKNRWWMVDVHHNGELFRKSDGRIWEQSWTHVAEPPRLDAPLDAYQDSGIPIAWTQGAWMLVDLGGGRTLAEYFAWTDPGGSLPAGPISRLAVGGIKKVLSGIGEMGAVHATGPRVGYVRPDQSPLDGPADVVVDGEPDTGP